MPCRRRPTGRRQPVLQSGAARSVPAIAGGSSFCAETCPEPGIPVASFPSSARSGDSTRRFSRLGAFQPHPLPRPESCPVSASSPRPFYLGPGRGRAGLKTAWTWRDESARGGTSRASHRNQPAALNGLAQAASAWFEARFPRQRLPRLWRGGSVGNQTRARAADWHGEVGL